MGRASIARSRALRQRETDNERKLWRLLRGRQLAHLKWRRQVPIGAHFVDSACFEKRLIVECDGSQHAESARDAARDAWLRAEGFEVVRFWNNDVSHNPASVMDTILARAGLPF